MRIGMSANANGLTFYLNNLQISPIIHSDQQQGAVSRLVTNWDPGADTVGDCATCW